VAGAIHDILELPKGPLANASLALVRSTESRPIADHSIRSFICARLLAEHEGALNDAAYDEQLLFAAAVMHDLGLGAHAQGHARFEVEGADLAPNCCSPTASRKPTSTGSGRRSRCTRPTASPSAADY
jgi:HD domain-containing protein